MFHKVIMYNTKRHCENLIEAQGLPVYNFFVKMSAVFRPQHWFDKNVQQRNQYYYNRFNKTMIQDHLLCTI